MKKLLSLCLALVVFAVAAQAQTVKPQQKKTPAKKSTKALTLQALKSNKMQEAVLRIKPAARKTKG